VYAAREGTQQPCETLKLGSGSCRDFALLMMEAARRLGVATRFVSGYLYDPTLDGGEDDGTVGAGYTHAWLQAYLPGAGWVPFDPTNNLLGGTQLIRVGVARDPSQAAPISGSWFGETGDYLGMDVNVTVRALESARPGDENAAPGGGSRKKTRRRGGVSPKTPPRAASFQANELSARSRLTRSLRGLAARLERRRARPRRGATLFPRRSAALVACRQGAVERIAAGTSVSRRVVAAMLERAARVAAARRVTRRA
jgi:hypothetical protein